MSTTPVRSLFVVWLFGAASGPLFAVDAVWLPSPNSADWNTGTNWSTLTAPERSGDTATFNTSTETSLTLSRPTTVKTITFPSTASVFTIDTNANTLTVQNGGFVNNSGQTQTISNSAAGTSPNGTLDFQTSSAGNVTITNNGSPNGSPGGFTVFHLSSTAGSATIVNDGGVGHSSTNRTDTSGGLTNFFQTSTAGNATIINEGGIGPESGGETEFDGSSSAGNSTIITNGGTGFDSGGGIEFVDEATGGTARAITIGNGVFDISQLSQNTHSLAIGSIEGSGSYFLGSKSLVVGGNI